LSFFGLTAIPSLAFIGLLGKSSLEFYLTD